MIKSPIYPSYENINNSDYDFDPQTDFIQFLEEARKHVIDEELHAKPGNPGKSGKQRLQFDKKQRKTWKASLFSWLKTGKKNKPSEELSKASTVYKQKLGGYLSGPLQWSANGVHSRARKSVSGPLKSFFSSTKTVENVVPYECLERLNNPRDLQSYGPVYLVT